MTQKEREDAKRVSRVIRAARKIKGISQVDLARSLDITQATLSNFESGRGIPSVSVWYDVCDRLQIPNATKTYRRGFIDYCTPTVPGKASDLGAFQISKRYLRHAASKVRTTKLFMRYFVSVYGEEKLEQYLERIGIDPDVFVLLDSQISVSFALDLFETMIRDGKLRPRDIPTLCRPVVSQEVQGGVASLYRASSDQQALIKNLFSGMNLYEANWDYRLEEEVEDGLILSVRPRPIMRHFNHKNSTLGTFLSDCRREWLRYFSTIEGGSPPRIETLENYYQGAPKCVYKMYV